MNLKSRDTDSQAKPAASAVSAASEDGRPGLDEPSEPGSGIVLVVDDDDQLRELYRMYLGQAGYELLEATSAADARAIVEETNGGLDCVLLDIHLGQDSGLDFMTGTLREYRELPIVMSTVSRNIEHALFAFRNGAYDYLIKPVSKSELLLAVRNAVQKGQMARELSARRALDGSTQLSEGDFVYGSAAMRAVVGVVDQVQDSSVPVLILGETGTGKEMVARRLHRRSRRKAAPFVTVNCASLPRELVESELFGHEKGAFTGAVARKLGRFEEAGEGTIFLDEIGELEPSLQAKLLRVLQEGEITPIAGKTIPCRARVVVATNRDLAEEVQAGRFRADLYYRLNVITLRLPPLRERREEIPLLAAHLLERFVRTDGLPRRVLAPDAVEALQLYEWPGNVRELENTLKRAALLCPRTLIHAADLQFAGGAVQRSGPSSTPGAPSADPVLAGPVRRLQEYEPELMLRALAETRGNVSAAARRLGIGRSTFYRRAQRYSLPL